MKKIILMMIAALLVVFGLTNITFSQIERDYGVDLAFGRRVVSTPHTDGNLNTHAVDANGGTRYASQEKDDAFYYIDLGSKEKIGKVVIDWEAAYASEYMIQLSNDAITWTTVANVTNTQQTVDEIVFSHWLEAQFVRFQGVKRATSWGYSFYSFEVYGPRSLAHGGTVLEVSSNENETILNKSHMLDNLAHTRWASAVLDNQHVIFDIENVVTFDMIKIRWEVSFARIFDIYIHPETGSIAPQREDEGWIKVVGSDVGLGEVDTLLTKSDQSSRYLKLELIQRETSENTKKSGRFPWQSTFSIYSFELFKWNDIDAIPIGNVMEFSKNGPAWPTMTNMTLFEGGLLLAPQGYPIDAIGKVTSLESIKDGNIPGFESYAVYNPGVIYDDDREMFHMIYRSELPDNFETYFGPKFPKGHMSTLSYASSPDGYHFTRGENNPILWPTLPEENGGGSEDPRIFKIVNDPNRGGLTTYYITFTMYDNMTTRQGIAYTHDFETFTKVGSISPNYNLPLKSGSFVTDPEGNAVKINDPRPGKTGQVYIIFMKDGAYARVGFTEDVINIKPEDIVDIDTAGFGGNSIEALTKWNESCMAITHVYGPDDENIYLMYGGTLLSNPNIQYQQPNVTGWFYALGALKTTQSNPFELTNWQLDLDEPSIYPTDTNKIDYGLFEKCMFADQMIRHKNTWFLYYGAGDMYVGLATARADFSAGAATYHLNGNQLSVSTMALNKRFNDNQTNFEIEFVAEIFDFEGNLIASFRNQHSISHFLHLQQGSYSRGQLIQMVINLSEINELPEQYYVLTYVVDDETKEIINHKSAYTVVKAVINRTAK
jgi:predicted GH43/DUF377 family glycosyl hydrolase